MINRKKKRGEGKAKKKDKDNIISNTTKERRKNGTAGKAEQVMKYIARCKLGIPIQLLKVNTISNHSLALIVICPVACVIYLMRRGAGEKEEEVR